MERSKIHAAFLTRVEVCDKSAGPRFNVAIVREDGSVTPRYLIRGPWCRSTAMAKLQSLREDIANGLVW